MLKELLYNLEHSLYVAAAAVLGYVIGFQLLFTLSAIFFFIGREHAQAEYRWIETFGEHKRANLPWWGALDKRVWDTHSLIWNLLLPIGVGIAALPVLPLVGYLGGILAPLITYLVKLFSPKIVALLAKIIALF